jgi:hypothetical protein
MHPDSHAIVEVPGTNIAFFGSDGGIVRSSAGFSDISSQCTTERGLADADLALCQQLLSAVPTRLFTTYNDGLSTLQFQSVSVNPSNANNLMGGRKITEHSKTSQFDNRVAAENLWRRRSVGFNVATRRSVQLVLLNFHDVNFQNGDPLKWVMPAVPS